MSGKDVIPRATVSPDGRILAATSPKATFLFSLPAGTTMAEIPGARVPLVFDSNRSFLTHTTLPEGLTRWSLTADEVHPEILHVESRQLRVIGNDGEHTFAVGGLDDWAASDDGRIIAMPNYSRGANLFLTLSPPSTGNFKFRCMPLGPQSDVRHCAVSPDGKWVVTGSHWTPGSVTVWDPASGRRVTDLISDQGIPKFSPDGRWLAVVSNSSENGGRLWRVDGWQPGPKITLGFLAFDRKTQTMAVQGDLGEIRLIRPDSGGEIARLTVSDMNRLKPECFSPDGSRLIAVGLEDGQLYVWDLKAIRQQLAQFGLDWDASPGSA